MTTADTPGRPPFSVRALRRMLLLGDLACVALALIAERAIRESASVSDAYLAYPIVAVSLVVGLYLAEAYGTAVFDTRGGMITRVSVAMLIAAPMIALLQVLIPRADVSGTAFSMLLLILYPAVLLWRGAGAAALGARLPRTRVLVIEGADPNQYVAEMFDASKSFDLVDRVPVDHLSVGSLAERVRRQAVDIVAVDGMSGGWSSTLLDQLIEVRNLGADVMDRAIATEWVEECLPVERLTPEWVAFSSRFNGWDREFEAKLKRLNDLLIVLVVGLFAVPLMAAIAILIRLTSPGPALFRQTRVGAFGRPYTLVKFRSMRIDAEKHGAVWASEDDPRATAFGTFLRKSHLDELPQLWNVLRGEMSIVGPRPERPEFVETLREEIPFYDLRHMVKPGVTGWAQVMYPYGASVEDARRKLSYDLYYIRHKNIFWDLRIILRTLTTSFLGRGSR